MCKITIIVAVYQGELYIQECLESLLRQDLDEYEVICIDDGSTDRTAEIILELQKRQSRIRYFYQENQGVSAARNKGLALANGKYVMFVDADDYIKKNSLAFLYRTAEKFNTDILVFGGTTDCPLKTPEWIRYAFYTKNKIYNQFSPKVLLEENGVRPSVCNKLFRRSIIGNRRFPENICIAEDLVFLFLVFPVAKNICFCKKKIYCYRIANELSAMHTSEIKSEFKFRNHLLAAEIIMDEWKKNHKFDCDEEMLKWLIEFLYGPFQRLNTERRLVYQMSVNNLGKLVGRDSLFELLCITDKCLDFKKKMELIVQDIQKLGFKQEVENLIYKILKNTI